MAYLRLEGISKRFGAFLANDGINLEVEAGSIHALLGENGAGKTTLMNILSGLYQPDAGQIYLQDQPVRMSSPTAAIQHGIGMIHQHFMLVPQLTVTENLLLGRGLDLRLNLKQKGEDLQALADSYGLKVDPQARVGDLPVGMQQRVEILKVLSRQARLLILDEPTAVLTPPEVGSLFTILKTLAANGHTLIFISHKLEEVLSLCDRVTVLRRGQVVAERSTQACSRQELAELMVGRDLSLQVQKPPAHPGEMILTLNNLQVQDQRGLPALQDVSLQLHSGEILGIAGVDGNGQRELADAIAGLTPVQAGQILWRDQEVTRWSPQQRNRHLQLGYIPEDRQTMGLILGFSIAKNLILKLFWRPPFCRWFRLQSQEVRSHALQIMHLFDVRASDPDVLVSALSGGNQQKVVLGRELDRDPTLIIAMQPTRGLDVGATAYVQNALLQARDRGAAILYISTELEEVMAMSDRIGVLYEGRLSPLLETQTTPMHQIGLLMAGQPLTVGSQA